MRKADQTWSIGWADLAILGIAVIWGASYPVTKVALASASVLTVILYRFGLTGLLMSALAWRDLAAISRADLGRGVLLGAILCSIFLAEVAGIALASATNAALIISLSTLLTPMLDYGLSRRLPPLGVAVGAALAWIGIALLAGGATSWSIGDSLLLLAAGLRAVMVVTTKRVMAASTLSSTALTALQANTVAVLTLAVALAMQGPAASLIAAPIRFWASIGFLTLFCTLAAFYVQNTMVRRTSPTRVALLMGTEPLFGLALAHLLIAEPVTTATFMGAALIVGGTFLGIQAETRRIKNGASSQHLLPG
ncbi:DMT family transporter [Acidisoma cellulosilytica]|uniref:DMT family transporter n=1 Tax=Acidisoma cellulosilyticum TaxID=2802395 RepID=A0A964E5B7_9PROT|nr:DMT family transporter [Acidisoma cellulosilyticum]MCB8881808.1 DMT family transporter [Acidisoma cellulosilyticum]